MIDLTDLWIALWDIGISGLGMGWPLLILALGLGGVAYFGERDKIKTAGGWIVALAGLLLFIWNLRG